MMGLLRSELLRLTSRRVFRWLALLLAVGIVVGGLLNFVTSERDPDETLRRAQQDVAQCEAQRAEYVEQFGAEEAEGWECGRAEDRLFAYDRGYHYASEMRATTRGVATLLLVLAFAVGASFAGAEWASGSLAMLLTWEPRRLRVLGAKLATTGFVVAVGTAIALAILAVVHLPAGIFRGYMSAAEAPSYAFFGPANADAVFWSDLAAIWGRSGALAGMFGMVGVAVGAVVRNTAGAIAAGGAYAAIVDPLLAVWREGALRPWLLFHNVPRFQGYEVSTEIQRDAFGGTSTSFEVLPIWRSAFLLSLYVLAVMAISYGVFRRRDVT